MAGIAVLLVLGIAALLVLTVSVVGKRERAKPSARERQLELENRQLTDLIAEIQDLASLAREVNPGLADQVLGEIREYNQQRRQLGR